MISERLSATAAAGLAISATPALAQRADTGVASVSVDAGRTGPLLIAAG